MAENLELGMYLYCKNDSIADFDQYINSCLANNITKIRLDIPHFENTEWVNKCKAAIIRCVAKGCQIIWGVTKNPDWDPGGQITALTWPTFRAGILEAAQWAQDNGVWEFQLGNEEESHNDNTTMTDADLITNIKALATEVKAIFTRGKVSYTCSWTHIEDWISVGKGDVDILCTNNYWETPSWTAWREDLDLLSAAFPKECAVTEFNLSSSSLFNYSTNKDLWYTAIKEMLEYMETKEINYAVYFAYKWGAPEGKWSVMDSDGTWRKLWDALKMQNDWKKKKTAGQANIRGLSHG